MEIKKKNKSVCVKASVCKKLECSAHPSSVLVHVFVTVTGEESFCHCDFGKSFGVGVVVGLLPRFWSGLLSS